MPFVVHLDFADGAAPVVDLCDRLAPDVETVPRLGGVPHLTLGIFDDLDPGSYAERLHAFAVTIEPLTLQLAGLGVFAGAGHVLYAAPVVTPQLLALHQAYHDGFAPPGAACHPHYRPGSWVPHVTLALRLSDARLTAAIGAIAPHWSAVEVTVGGVGLVRYPPVEIVWRAPVGA